MRFSQAGVNDLEMIANLESLVWGASGATLDQLSARLITFPTGQLVAKNKQGEVIGYLGLQRISDFHNIASWNEVTDHGFIRRSHKKDGEYFFGISLTAHPSYKGTGMRLQIYGVTSIVRQNGRGVLFGSRVPGFAAASKKFSIEDWVYGDGTHSNDWEVEYYQRSGCEIVSIKPNYFKDLESHDYGVLMYLRNPFYDWPASKVWSVLFKITSIVLFYLSRRKNVMVTKLFPTRVGLEQPS